MIDRLNAALADRYRIERELGAGGMATVYLAEDLRHDRRVALKVLRPELAAVVGADRFLAEIRTTANLQHPNILPLFDSGEADGFLFFVMPYVEGESLRERLDREKQLPIEEAVRVATEVADALQAAHDQGVIHRDIKPANILLSHGRPLVADFGIALAVSSAGGGRLTETGLSLGTPYYMSPEQASADRDPAAASDIYSLGCVLYEMLVGEPPHTGRTAQAVLAQILTAAAPNAAIARPTIPANVDAVIRKALERLPADRFARAQDFARALADRSFRHGEVAATVGVARPGPWKAVALAASVVAAGAIAMAGSVLLRPAPPEQVARFGSLFLAGQERVPGGDFTIAPDGRSIVYVGPAPEPGELPRLWVRQFADLEASPIDYTDGFLDHGPSISPDGSEVVFGGRSADGLKVVRLAGGPVRTLMTEAHSSPFWGPDGYVYASASGQGIFRVPAAGGTPEQVSRMDPMTSVQRLTDVLPGGRWALVSLISGGDPARVGVIAILDLQTSDVRRVGPGRSARFVEPDYLVFIADDGTLAGARFDVGAGELRGPVVPLLDGVEAFSLSNTGTLLYAPLYTPEHEFTWVTRAGEVIGAAPGWQVDGLVPRGFELSPDETRLALAISDGTGRTTVWVKELPDGAIQRVSTSAAENWGPRWLASGDLVSYTSGATGSRVTLSRRFNGTGSVDTLFDGSLDAPDSQVDPNGEWIILRFGLQAGRNRAIAAGRLGPGADAPAMILGGTYNASQPALSPDGHWLAYTSDESGRNEVYVRPFPDIDADRITVSAGGGMQPRWSRDAAELFYVAGNVMMAARIEFAAPARVSSRDTLFTIPSTFPGMASSLATNYDVASDGRLLMARAIEDPNAQAPGLIVVQNWVEVLKAALAGTPDG